MLRTATLAIGTALLIILIWRLGLQEILAALRQIGPYAAVVVPLYVAHHATRAFALRTCVLPPTRLGYLEAVAIRLSGEAVQVLTVTGPVPAEPARAWLLQRRGLTLTEGCAATISEYLLAKIGLLRGRWRPDMQAIDRMEDILGLAEGAYALIFGAVGLPPEAGFTLAFARRIRTIAVASVGRPTLVRLLRDRRHSR